MNSPDLLFLECAQYLGSLSFGQESDPKEKSAVNAGHSAPKPNPEALKVLIVEDNDSTRKVVCDLLLREPGISVVSEAANGLDGVRLVQAFQPDVVLLDITMPTLGGIEAAVRIRRVAPDVRIVFLSQHNLEKLAEAALATGAQGYVLKSTAGTDLIPAIRSVMEGKKFVSKLKG